ncbi:hypothetical protein D4765_18760 [Subtercola vilae]|uniref:Sigma-70 family RNA polymerase sigma factor n=1 Tax=Subtercola vilae TaxID=2056433 RepID=A0A4T2BDA5_9MICO|nr:hypothetical protein D4765_18760 [Subtercola vilae]
MPKSNQGLEAAARQHLELLKNQHNTLNIQDRLYVGLAYTYGITVPEIVSTSGIPTERVRALLGGE